MNKNLNWSDNRVLGAAAAAPKAQESPLGYQGPAIPTQPTGVSPATYQAPANNSGVSPATYQNAPTGVSPATYQKMDNTGVSPATYQKMDTTGVSPATYPESMQMPAPTRQDMAAMPYAGMASGVTPGPVTPTTGVGMQAIPTEPQMGNETLGAITRNSAYAPMPITGEPGPPSVMDPGYIPGYQRTQIGKRVRAEFVFQNLYLDKTGILRYVGYNYFVLEDSATRAMIMCDLYSARFVTSV